MCWDPGLWGWSRAVHLTLQKNPTPHGHWTCSFQNIYTVTPPPPPSHWICSFEEQFQLWEVYSPCCLFWQIVPIDHLSLKASIHFSWLTVCPTSERHSTVSEPAIACLQVIVCATTASWCHGLLWPALPLDTAVIAMALKEPSHLIVKPIVKGGACFYISWIRTGTEVHRGVVLASKLEDAPFDKDPNILDCNFPARYE